MVAERPLRRVTMNLFAEDVEWLEEHRYVWTELIRELVHKYVTTEKREGSP